jgi:hypothetical protein
MFFNFLLNKFPTFACIARQEFISLPGTAVVAKKLRRLSLPFSFDIG